MKMTIAYKARFRLIEKKNVYIYVWLFRMAKYSSMNIYCRFGVCFIFNEYCYMNALLTSYCVNDFKIVLYELEIWIRLSDTEYVIRFFFSGYGDGGEK